MTVCAKRPRWLRDEKCPLKLTSYHLAVSREIFHEVFVDHDLSDYSNSQNIKIMNYSWFVYLENYYNLIQYISIQASMEDFFSFITDPSPTRKSLYMLVWIHIINHTCIVASSFGEGVFFWKKKVLQGACSLYTTAQGFPSVCITPY